MPIKVNISISSGGRFKPVSSHTLHEKRITVGRDKECTVTLEDTQKHVSRTHAEFEEKDGAYWLKVVSKVNPVIVNGKRHMFGDRLAMADGDHISIGLYKLEIVEARVAPPARIEPPKQAEERPEDITYVASRAAFPSGLTSPAAPRPEAAEPSEEATFVRAPKAPAAPRPKAPPPPEPLPEMAAEAEEATYVPPVKVVPAPPPPPPPAPTVKTTLPDAAFADDEVTYIPPMWARPPSARTSPADDGPGADDSAAEDMTNFRRPLAAPASPAVTVAPPPAEVPPLAEASPPPTVESADAVDFDLSDAFEEEATTLRPAAVPVTPAAAPVKPAAAPVPPAPPAPEAEEDFSEDMTYVRRPSEMPKRTPAPAPAPAPEIPAYSEAERLADEETHYRVAPTIGPRVAAGAVDPGGNGALHAFLDGAGLSGLAVPDPEKFMRDTGIMVRAAVEGVMMLLLARAEARKELGAEAETDAADNPLTSMASPAEVIAFLFDPNRPAIGDADPVQAFGDACGDLRAHQVALLAGMRAAVQSALQRIDPKKIEREHGVNLGGLNLTRKSKLWDISVAQHEQLVREAEENFGTIFGREILAAYTAQLRKMRGGR